MIPQKHLKNIWLKASVLGCLWASSEIVIGSFLHNLRVPFCGNILTGIGIIIMVSIGQLWTERGLFWRAGLVCALMKSISPSAVIFGPMLAIFCEALLMELSTLPCYIIAFLIERTGDVVESDSTLSLVINYGTNIIRFYEEPAALFQNNWVVVSDNYWCQKSFIFYVIGGCCRIIQKICRKHFEEAALTGDTQYINKKNSSESTGTFLNCPLFSI